MDLNSLPPAIQKYIRAMEWSNKEAALKIKEAKLEAEVLKNQKPDFSRKNMPAGYETARDKILEKTRRDMQAMPDFEYQQDVRDLSDKEYSKYKENYMRALRLTGKK